MRIARQAFLVCALLALSAAAATGQSVFEKTRFELGFLDDRLLMFLTQTAPLVQQFTGMTAAALVPCAGVDWGKARLDWTVALETALAFDSTGLARWCVRASEQSIINKRTGGHDRPPAFSADLLFGTPLYLPLRVRSEAELRVWSRLRLQLGVEAAGILLLYPPDVWAFRSDFGLTLGTQLALGPRFGLGLRARITNFGDSQDRWPGFGATMYLAWEPFVR